MMNPINLFSTWYKQYLGITVAKQPAACCLSTIGLDKFPNARFVALKDITGKGFIVTGTLTSRKGKEISKSKNVALTFWWAETEKQVRIQGEATLISSRLADKYFAARKKDSQIVSTVSNQGATLSDIDELSDKYNTLDKSGKLIKRPPNWGGYLIKPVKIEFLAFKSNRFHDRSLYELKKGTWEHRKLQP